MERKTALVTGACVNTGVAIVEKFASEGYNVVFTRRSKEKVSAEQADYRKKFPLVKIDGYVPVSYTHLDVYKRQMRF